MSLFLLIVSVLYLISVVTKNSSVFTTRFDPSVMKKLYEESQWQQSQNFSPMKILDTWALKNKYTGWNNYVDENKQKINTEKVKEEIIQAVRKKGISDAQLYAYAGYRYINGADPTLLNPEHPPLGKYLIGLSIQLFHNENIILLFCAIITLILVFTIVYLHANNFLLSSLAVFLTATQTLFVDQLIHGPQLELFQLMFFMLLILFLVLFDKHHRFIHIIFAGISLGLLLSIKTAFTYYPLLFIFLGLLVPFSKRFKVREFLAVHTVAFLVFMTTYLSYFIHGGTVRKWFGVQKYIIVFYKQSGIDIIAFAGNYLRLIFTGSWKFWSDNTPVSHYSGWSIMWPVIFVVASYIIMKKLSEKKKMPFMDISLLFFILLYNFFLFIVPMFPRYLLLLFIPMIILICTSVSYIVPYEKKTD